jgi:O-antigen ligase
VNLVATHIALVGLHLPPQLALFLTLAFIVFLFRRDIRERPNVSSALWLPLLWLVIGCSRTAVAWLNIFGLPVSGPVSSEEGSPVDALFQYAMLTAGLLILINRQVSLSEVLQRNGWIVAFIAYCFISIVWSDNPLITFRRCTKLFLHPVMALIVLTEPDFEEGLTRLMKGCAYVVVPISILWIRYYSLGTSYDQDTGMPYYTGISTGKNGLGMDCLLLGLFFFWYLLQTWRTERNTQRRNELWLIAGFLICILYLMRLAYSATSNICLLVAILIVVFVGIRPTIKNSIGTYTLAALVLIVAAQLAFGISARLSESLGKGSTLTGRTDLWACCLEVQSSPILGEGFENFWVPERRAKVAAFFHSSSAPGSAHNSYLDTYLELGLIGLSILIGLVIATFWKIRLELFRNFEWGRLRLAFFVAALLRGWTETMFTTASPLWFVFYIIAMDYPLTHLAAARPSVWAARSQESREFAYAEGET